ncbi:hypothetical protein LTSERUB_6616, partial [Salmonella enterica subsp. enterica serovar Rubislaw str. A4-653]
STTETNFMKKNLILLLYFRDFWHLIILYGQVIHLPEQVICLV